jgi:cupin 2 domain-containing protein
MIPSIHNLFTETFIGEGPEEFRTLLEGRGFRLESIISRGQSSSSGFWYDQPEAEWVLLARGTASLAFEGVSEVQLQSGDYLLIPPHCKHRVLSTSKDALWLALYANA